jgi:hypothetical protein
MVATKPSMRKASCRGTPTVMGAPPARWWSGWRNQVFLPSSAWQDRLHDQRNQSLSCQSIRTRHQFAKMFADLSISGLPRLGNSGCRGSGMCVRLAGRPQLRYRGSFRTSSGAVYYLLASRSAHGWHILRFTRLLPAFRVADLPRHDGCLHGWWTNEVKDFEALAMHRLSSSNDMGWTPSATS